MKKKYLFILIAVCLVAIGLRLEPVFASSQNVVVVDEPNQDVQELSNTGTFLRRIGSTGNGDIFDPNAVVIDSSGHFWVAESGNDRVEEFSATGTYMQQFGSYGTGTGQFDCSGGGGCDLAIATSGNVWVSDANNGRVEEFSATGTYLQSIGGGGLNYPDGLGIDASGNLWVIESYAGRVDKYSSTGTLLSHFNVSSTYFDDPFGNIVFDAAGHLWTTGDYDDDLVEFNTSGTVLASYGSLGSGNLQFNQAMGLAMSAAGNFYVSDWDNARIEEISATGTYINTYAQNAVTGPGDMAFDSSGNLWEADYYTNSIQEFSATGTYESSFGQAACAGGIVQPHGRPAIDSSGNIWVSDSHNNCVSEFSSTGTFESSFGSAGSGNGNFTQPASIAIASSGSMWVVDQGNNRVEGFSATGTYINKFGSAGSTGGKFNTPTALAFDPSGNLWVTDYGNNRIQKFTPSGTTYAYSAAYGTSGTSTLNGPWGIAFDSSGNAWVGDNANNRVVEFSATGTYKGQIGCAPGDCSTGSATGTFNGPNDVAFDANGNIWVSDSNNARVEEFSSGGTYMSEFGSTPTGIFVPGTFSQPGGLAFTAGSSTPPATISSVSASPGTASAVITWTTSVGADSQVNYGLTSSYGNSSSYNASYVTSHSVTITGLSLGTTYHYQVVSSDGTSATSSDYTFTTNNITSTNGNVYVADNYNNRVEIFNTSGTYESQFGNTSGTWFTDPYGVAVDSSGNVWTTDNTAGDVQGYTSAGSYISSFGSGHLANPSKLVIDSSGHFWVEDMGNENIQEFSATGTYMQSISIGNSGDGIAINGSGTILVALDSNVIDEYSSTGTLIGSFGTSGTGNGQYDDIDGLTISGNKLFVDDANNNRVQILTASGTTYAYSGQFGSSGSGNGQFTDANNIAVDSSGHLWISDKDNNNVQEFYASGTTYVYHAQFGSRGGGNGQFITPYGIAIDSSNNIYVADSGNARMEKFTSSGLYSLQYGQPPAGTLSDPRDVAIDPSGNVWVTNQAQDNIEEFTAAGTYESSFSLSGTGDSDPQGLAIDSSGNFWISFLDGNEAVELSATGTEEQHFGSAYIAEGASGIALTTSSKVWVGGPANGEEDEFSATGTYITDFTGSGANALGYELPAIAIDKSGNIWVADNTNQRIEEFSATGTYESQINITTLENGSAYADIEGLTFDSNGNIWFTDAYHNDEVVDEVSATGTLIQQIGYNGTGEGSSANGQFSNPLGIAVGGVVSGNTNISSASLQHDAWNDKIGWIDFYDTQNIVVSSATLTGYASSSAGSISLDCHTSPNGNICTTSDYGVDNDGSGNLSGWAWNDMYGWISFCGNSSGGGSTWNGSKWVCPGSPTYQVVINPSTGVFSGWAWNDNIGWISFNCSNSGASCTNGATSTQYDVVTSWTVTGSSTQGTLDSETFDTGVTSGAQINSIIWQGSEPASTTVGFQLAVSASSTGPWSYAGPDGTSATEYLGLPGVPITLTDYPVLKARYFRYRIILNTNSTGTATPRVQGVSVNWSR